MEFFISLLERNPEKNPSVPPLFLSLFRRIDDECAKKLFLLE